MAVTPLGKVTVTTAGTPVRVTSTRTGAQAILVQAVSTNTGKIYVGNSSLNKSTLAGVYFVIPAASASDIPSFEFSIPLSPAGLNAADIYLDADNNGEAAIVTITAQ